MIKIYPSKLDLACACPAAPVRNLAFPFEKSEASERGLDLHERTALVLDAGLEELDGICEDLPEDDKQAVKTAVEVAVMLKPKGKHERWIETKLFIKVLGGNGKMDLAYFDYESGSLMVCDWKFGKGEVPDPSDNKQLQAYVLVLRDELKAKGIEVLQAYLVICQPCGTPRQSYRDALFPAQVFPAWEKEIESAVKAANAKDAPATPGTHCKRSFCEAGKHGACPEFKAYSEGKAVEKESRKASEAAFAVGGFAPVIVESPTVSFPIVVLSEEAIAKAQDLLAQAQAPVTDQASADSMGRTLQAITTFEGQVDKNREVAKKPVLDLGRAIDDAARKALIPLREGKALASKNLMDWKKGEDDKAALARFEHERVKRLAEEAERKAREEGLAAARRAQEATSKAERDKALEDAKQAALRRLEAEKAIQVEAPIVQAPIKIAGVKTQLVPEIEVLDFAAMPDMFKVTDDAMLKKAVMAEKVTNKDTWVKIKWVEKAASTGRR